MNFSEALKAMKMGNKVSREAWRGKIAHWIIVPDEGKWGPLTLKEYYPDGNYNHIVNIKFEDTIAEDWWIVT